MSALPIVRVGDPVLRRRADEVPPAAIGEAATQDLIDAMVATMRAAPGVGLAAPQVGCALRLIVVEDPPEAIERLTPEERAERGRLQSFPLHVMINPQMRAVAGSARATFAEGCLSIPGFVGLVERDLAIDVTFLDRGGARQDWRRFEGWRARIIQHEIDHLDGILYTDHVVPCSFMTDLDMRARLAAKAAAAAGA